MKKPTLTDNLITALKTKPNQTVRSLVDNFFPMKCDVKVRRRLMSMKDRGLVTRSQRLEPVPFSYTQHGRRTTRAPRPRLIWRWRVKETE